MSIRNLTTDNLKNDQNLQVNSIEAITFAVDTLTVDTLDANQIFATSADITTLNASTGTIETLSSTDLDVTNATIQNCDVTSGLTLPSSPYTDLTLNIYTFHQSNITWTLYTVPAIIGNGIQFYRIGRMITCILLPFSLTGASVGAGETLIVTDFVFPDTFRPLNIPCVFKTTRLQQGGAYIPVIYRMEGSGNYTIEVAKQDQTAFANGVLNLVQDELIYCTYISLS